MPRLPRLSPFRLLLATTLAVAVVLAPAVGGAQQGERRLFAIDDIFNLKRVSDPQISSDGEWVAFSLSQLNREEDRSDSDIWMAPLDGGEALRLTTSDRSESRPRWSPDGRWLAFMSSRESDSTQVWLLPRIGGEAWQLTDVEQGVSAMEWSPDSSRLALLVQDPKKNGEEGEEGEQGEKDEKGEKEERPEPIVVNRLQFKSDGIGYLDERRTHVYVFDVAAKSMFQLTEGPYDDGSPVWSPDGTMIAFVSNRTEEPDSNDNSDIWVIDAREGATPRKLTEWIGADASPAFSPDGAYVVYSQGGDPADVWYDTNDIALVPVAGGEARVLTEGLDRNIVSPRVTPDGSAVLFLLEDHGRQELAGMPLTGGDIARFVADDRAIYDYDIGPGGEVVVLETTPAYPNEISRVVRDSGGDFVAGRGAAAAAALRRITHMNDELLAGIRLAEVREFEAINDEGIAIQGFLTLPPDAPEGERLPTLLRIHGGPVSQFQHEFNTEWQILAAHGYAVVSANPRGSSGRGRDFSNALFANWGNPDFVDVMAAVDHVIDMGIADPDRLGVGGWSYGGILTNYVITKTGRFKAAISGASEVNYTANYGHDHYQQVWEDELGLPWENTALWIELSPFFHVANVTTPTLVMGGQEDWNVPLQNSDQLYQALRRLGVPTQLVIYPGESHGISRPSFQVDRYRRYVAWYDKWVK